MRLDGVIAHVQPCLCDLMVIALRLTPSEVYHTKRMQRLFAVRWSADAKYIISGSDETSIRCVFCPICRLPLLPSSIL